MAKRYRVTRPPSSGKRPANRLLACLPEDDFQRLRPHLTTVPVKTKQIFHKPNEPVENVVFPNGGVASPTTVMSNGAMVEVATVGDEGLLGISAFLDDEISGLLGSASIVTSPACRSDGPHRKRPEDRKPAAELPLSK